MGLQLFKISPCALCLFIVHVSKEEAAIPRFWKICSVSLTCNFPAQQSLRCPRIPWFFLGAELFTGFALQSQSESLCVHISIAAIMCWAGLQTPPLLCKWVQWVLCREVSLVIPGALKHHFFITTVRLSGITADRGVPSTWCIHVPFGVSWNLSFRFQLQLLKFH